MNKLIKFSAAGILMLTLSFSVTAKAAENVLTIDKDMPALVSNEVKRTGNIYLHLNNGSNEVLEYKGVAGTSIFSETTIGPSYNTPIKDGYIFKGWYTEPEGGKLVDLASATPTDKAVSGYFIDGFDCSYYAQYEEKESFKDGSISFISNNGTGDIQTVKGKNANLVDFNSFDYKEPVKEGYRFIGWYSQMLGGEKVEFSKNSSNPFRFKDWCDCYVYAQYEKIDNAPIKVSANMVRSTIGTIGGVKLNKNDKVTYELNNVTVENDEIIIGEDGYIMAEVPYDQDLASIAVFDALNVIVVTNNKPFRNSIESFSMPRWEMSPVPEGHRYLMIMANGAEARLSGFEISFKKQATTMSDMEAKAALSFTYDSETGNVVNTKDNAVKVRFGGVLEASLVDLEKYEYGVVVLKSDDYNEINKLAHFDNELLAHYKANGYALEAKNIKVNENGDAELFWQLSNVPHDMHDFEFVSVIYRVEKNSNSLVEYSKPKFGSISSIANDYLVSGSYNDALTNALKQIRNS